MYLWNKVSKSEISVSFYLCFQSLLQQVNCRNCCYEHSLRLIESVQVNGKRGPGRPKMTWKQLTERDRREWKLSAIDPHDRDTWRSGVRSAMHAASQLPGRGPTVVDMAPIPAR